MDNVMLIASVGAAAAVVMLFALALLISRLSTRSGRLDLAVAKMADAQRDLFGRMDGVGAQLSEVAGRLSQVNDEQARKHGELARAVNERLDSLGHRLSSSMTDQGSKTSKAIGDLEARLRVIDAAQKNIVDLSSQVVSLQDILSNKQARGAFGQGQMETIISDSLPADAYQFQAQLSNGTRPDCLILLPRSTAAIVIDAKFPRESFAALASAEGSDALRAAQTRVRAEMRKHIDDIASKYLIPGETQDPAIMFVPAESIFCTVFAEFFEVIQHAQRKRVTLLSPNMLMLAVNTMRALMRDQRMREQAHLIQDEVRKLMGDVERLGDRAGNLRRHFGMAEKDLRDIETSAAKITSRGERIASENLDDVAVLDPEPAQRMLLAGE